MSRTIEAPRDAVWALVIDPTSYPDWLVGCRKIREIDEAWPEPGSAFHHTIGLLPVLVRDNTKVVRVADLRVLELEVRFRPIGVGRVVFHLDEQDDDTTVITVDERIFSGLLGHVSDFVLGPPIALRNWWSLRSLGAHAADLAAQTAQ